jgi:hypothetical protein
MILTMMSGGAYAQSCAPNGTPCGQVQPFGPGSGNFCGPILVGGVPVTCCNACWFNGNLEPGEICAVCQSL